MNVKRMVILSCMITIITLVLLISHSCEASKKQISKRKSTAVKETLKTLEPEDRAQALNDLTSLICNYLDEQAIDISKIGFSIHDLITAEEYNYLHTTDFVAASLYKLPLAMLYYEMLDEHRINENDTITYTEDCYEEGGPIGYTFQMGEAIDIHTLLYDMIIYSDNTAGHMLFEYLGGWSVYRNEIKKYSTLPYSDTFYDNIFTTSYMNDVLIYLVENSSLYQDLIDQMKLVFPNDYLSKSVHSPIAQKYGSYETAENAVGIVYGKHPYTIAIMTDLGSQGIQVIGDINEIAYRYFNEK